MNWTNQLLEIPMMCGLIFILVGLIMWLFPPKKINVLYGYRTPRSMKSHERWKFAQKYSAAKLIIAGLILGMSSTVGVFVRLAPDSKLIFGAILTFVAISYIIFSTEKAIKDKFPTV